MLAAKTLESERFTLFWAEEVLSSSYEAATRSTTCISGRYTFLRGSTHGAHFFFWFANASIGIALLAVFTGTSRA